MTTIGNYKLVRQIAEGGFGRTYEARHLLLDEKACLKQNLKVTEEDEKLLRQEAKLLWHIHHHSLPAMRDYFKSSDGSYIMAMSFVEGKTLEQSVKKHKAIHPEDVCWISQRMLNALNYLHHHGIIHGDVKPANIIVQPKVHNAVLVDYGLSSLRPKRYSASIGYTPVFAAPEFMQEKPPLPSSDLYSLGLTMMYVLGGDPISKTMPDQVPQPIQKFFKQLAVYNPLERPDWQKQDLVEGLSDIRYEVFGRRHLAELPKKMG